MLLVVPACRTDIGWGACFWGGSSIHPSEGNISAGTAYTGQQGAPAGGVPYQGGGYAEYMGQTGKPAGGTSPKIQLSCSQRAAGMSVSAACIWDRLQLLLRACTVSASGSSARQTVKGVQCTCPRPSMLLCAGAAPSYQTGTPSYGQAQYAPGQASAGPPPPQFYAQGQPNDSQGEIAKSVT